MSRVEEISIPMTWAKKMPVSISWLLPVNQIPGKLFQLEENKIKKIQEARDKLELDIKKRLERAMSLAKIDENSTKLKKRSRSGSNFSATLRQSSFVPLNSPSLDENDLEW